MFVLTIGGECYGQKKTMPLWANITLHGSCYPYADLLLISLYLHNLGDYLCNSRDKAASLQITP